MKINKIAAAVMSVALIFSVSSCKDAGTEDSGVVVLESETSATSAGTGATSASAGASDITSATEASYRAFTGEFEFIYNGVTIKPNIKSQPVVDAIGEEYQYFEADSCASLGISKTYTYRDGAFSIVTEPLLNKEDTVYQVTLYKADVVMPEGVKIGDTKDKVVQVYGNPSESDDDSAMYTKGNDYMMFTFSDGKIDSITLGTEI